MPVIDMPPTEQPFSCCVVIPCYNHGDTLAKVLQQLAPFNMPCLLVDDGSDVSTQLQLQQLASQPSVTLLRLASNQGKGVAVLHGLQAALEAGFSHALQVDADGQHQLADVPQLLDLAQRHPQALISGQPLYDHSIPRARRYGRWITHFWVWIETLSFSIKDSMCGFRVYPLAATLAVAARYPVGRRMDFDTEIMVRLYWQGHPSYFVPTRVIYPAGGISHFRGWQDNWRISRMHSRLFFTMLKRQLTGLYQKLWIRLQPLVKVKVWQKTDPHNPQRHWALQPEARGLWGMRIMLLVYRLCGRGVFTALLYPVVAVYWLTVADARRASQQWLSRVRQYQLNQHQQPLPALNSFQHFLHFASTMLDKIASWRGELQLGRHLLFAEDSEQQLRARLGKGTLILASHLGNVEACRALAQHLQSQPITALVFHQHAQRFTQIMQQMAPQASLNLLPVTEIGPDTAILLQQRLEKGEWVAIVGDRVAINQQRGGWRVSWSEFVGSPAPFPQGPFILARILRCPVLLLFALRYPGQKQQLHIHCEPFIPSLTATTSVTPARAQRQQALQQAVDHYASRLQHYALLAPLEWFNFFDFWQLPASDITTMQTGSKEQEGNKHVN